MAAKLPFRRIKPQMIFFFFIAVLLPMVVVSSIIYYQRITAIKTEAFQKLTAIRDLKVNQLNNWLNERTVDLMAISRDMEINQLAKTFIYRNTIQKEPNVFRSAESLLTSFVEEHKVYDEIFLINASNGIVTLSSEKSSQGMNVSDSPFYTVPLRSRQFYIRDIYYSRLLKKPAMCFALPIYSELPGGRELSAVLVARVDLEQSLYALLLERTGMGETGETLIVNKDVMALNELKWYDNAPLKLKINAEPAVLASQRNSGVIETLDYRNVPVLASYTYLPTTQWGFVAKQDLSEIYAPIRKMLINIVITLIISGLVAYVMAHVLAMNFLDPILEVAEAAGQIRKGDLSVRCNVKKDDEFGLLARTFNEMTESMEVYKTTQKGLRDLDDILVMSTTVDNFGKAFIPELIKTTRSDFGVFYLYDPDKIKFRYIFSMGFHSDTLKSLDDKIIYGAFDRTCTTREIIFSRDIPCDTVFTINTIAGNALPGCMVTIPVFIQDKVAAIIALGGFNAYSEAASIIIQQIQPRVGTALSNIISNEKTALLALELKEKNMELKAQAGELQAMTNNLKQQNIELDKQSRQLEQASRLKSIFLSNMSHELRTPLNSIMALSSVLKMDTTQKFTPEEVEYLDVIERNGRRLLDLINDILDLSKIEAGHMDFTVSSFSIKNTLENIQDSLQPLAKQKALSLNLEILTDLPEIQSDEKRVYQIIMNLMSNAVKFTEKGEVSVIVERDEHNVFINVKDTGIGISEKDLPFIFEAFKQVDSSTSRRYEGTGLGLAIAYKATKNLGGQLSVKSREEKGTTFTLTLPITWQARTKKTDGFHTIEPLTKERMISAFPEEKMNPMSHNVTLPKHTGKRILVIEDNEAAIIQIKMILEQEGYIVDLARGGKEAGEIMAHTVPDGIILDLMMPDVDGFDVLEKLRSTKETANIPVLVLTAKDLTPDDFKKLSANHIQQLVQKGDIEREGLLLKVNIMLGEQPSTSGMTLSNEKKSRTSKIIQLKPLNPATPPPFSRHPRILAIEDNPDNMLTLRAVLKDTCTLLEATDGETGIQAALDEQPDLILLDISLPGMDGYAAVKELKTNDATSRIPIIALTAHAMKGDHNIAVAAGFNDYISKPINQENILKTIEKWTGGI